MTTFTHTHILNIVSVIQRKIHTAPSKTNCVLNNFPIRCKREFLWTDFLRVWIAWSMLIKEAMVLGSQKQWFQGRLQILWLREKRKVYLNWSFISGFIHITNTASSSWSYCTLGSLCAFMKPQIPKTDAIPEVLNITCFLFQLRTLPKGFISVQQIIHEELLLTLMYGIHFLIKIIPTTLAQPMIWWLISQ